MAEGIDYAWGHPSPDALVKAGIKFAMRYISLDSSKDLDGEELAGLFQRGIGVGLVFETTANRALSGRAAGVKDAQLAEARLKSLGLSVPVYFAADFDATDAQKPLVASYLSGAVSVLGKSKVGVYGGYWVVKYMAEHDVCDWFWQTYAWSGGNVHPKTHIYQYRNGVTVGGVSCDLDKSLRDPYGVAFPKRTPALTLRAMTGYWAWVQWRLGEDNWAGWGPCNPTVRPDVPKLIPPTWWVKLRAYLLRRQ